MVSLASLTNSMKAILLLTLLPLVTLAAEADLVKVRTDGSTTRLKAGESGRLSITLSPREGAHVSREAPLRIELASAHAQLEKERLTLADAAEGHGEGGDARFEVAFTPIVQGPMTLEATLSFFVCTQSTCERQTRAVSLRVEVQ